jgi:hypothetical protein
MIGPDAMRKVLFLRSAKCQDNLFRSTRMEDFMSGNSLDQGLNEEYYLALELATVPRTSSREPQLSLHATSSQESKRYKGIFIADHIDYGASYEYVM